MEELAVPEMRSDAVTDRMKYTIKPSAVRSENLLHNFKATNGRAFPIQLGQEIIFEFPGMGNGYYCDFSTSYFRMGVNCAFTNAIANATLSAAGVTANAVNQGYMRFDRGLESIFRRIQIFDASGNLLENFENYNDLYWAIELMTNNSTLRSRMGNFHGEGLLVPHNSENPDASGGMIGAANDVGGAGLGYFTPAGNPFEVHVNGYNAQIPYVKYPDLGGIIAGQHCAPINVTNTANIGTTVDFSNFMQATQALPIGTATNTYKYFTFQLLSAMFGGASEKYIPMSAINGLRIVMTLEDPAGCLVQCGLGLVNNTAATQTACTTTIYDPTLFLNMVRVDPAVDQALKNTAKGRDNLIRISSQTWSTYQTSIAANTESFEYLIPIRVSSLKAIYFTFAKQSYKGLETFQDFLYPHLGTDSKTTWFDNCLLQYQFFLDGKPTPATPVQVKTGYSEVISELARSLHIGHKGADGQYLSLLCSGSLADYPCRNFILGQEFESFNGKGPVIESGYNTLNSTLTLRLDFDTTGLIKQPPPAVCVGGNMLPALTQAITPIASYLKVFCLYDTFLTIDDSTGVMRTEF